MSGRSDRLPRRRQMRRRDSDSAPQEGWGPLCRKEGDLLSLGGLAIDPGTLVRVMEPSEAAAAVLCQQLMTDTYDKPFLVEDGKHRAMCFTIDGSVQSEMLLDDPHALVNDYTRKMMGFLLFCPEPRRVLMIGLGGGSLVKFCNRHLPTTHVTVVEIDANVIALRSHFEIPPDGDRPAGDPRRRRAVCRGPGRPGAVPGRAARRCLRPQRHFTLDRRV